MKTLLALALALVGPQDPSVERARKVLDRDPEDPAANLTLGLHYALLPDWERALPHLGKVRSEAVRAAVEADLARGADPRSAIDAGNLWLKAAAAAPAKDRPGLQARAVHLYADAYARIDEEPWRERLRTKLLALSGVRSADGPFRGGVVPRGWSLWNAERSGLDPGAARDGRQSVRLGELADAGKYPSVTFPPFTPRPGAEYTLSAWVLTDRTVSPGEVRIRFWDAAGKFLGQPGVLIPDDAPHWRRVERAVVAPDGAAKADFQIVVHSRKGRTWVDDVSLRLDGREILENGGFEK